MRGVFGKLLQQLIIRASIPKHVVKVMVHEVELFDLCLRETGWVFSVQAKIPDGTY